MNNKPNDCKCDAIPVIDRPFACCSACFDAAADRTAAELDRRADEARATANDGCCDSCGVSLVECSTCAGVGHHREGCPEIED